MATMLQANWFGHAIRVLRNISDFHDPEPRRAALVEAREMLTKKMTEWQAKLRELNSRNEEFQRQVELLERKLHAAQMDTSCAEAMERLKEEQSVVIARERELDDCLEAIEEQLYSIKTQKETLEKPDPDEGFLKNELSLFLNVSSILPDLGDPKFSGTYVDKQKGVKTFKFSADSMTPFEICQAAWDMMK